MPLSTNFNVTPYYDDYDESKEYYRILFRPGYAVQAREVTQLQTVLQKQIERYGQHMFKDGSRVVGGDFEKFSGDVLYIENRSPVTRADDQIEDVKLIIEF